MDHHDPEAKAAMQLMAAMQTWLEQQQFRQPAEWPAIKAAIGAAIELRVEISMQMQTRFANIRAVTVDGEGTEKMLLAAINLTPQGRPGGGLAH